MKAKTKPKKVHTQRIERGTGICVQAEIPYNLQHQLSLEIIRRKRAGQPATYEVIVAEAIRAYSHNWPTVDQFSQPSDN